MACVVVMPRAPDRDRSTAAEGPPDVLAAARGERAHEDTVRSIASPLATLAHRAGIGDLERPSPDLVHVAARREVERHAVADDARKVEGLAPPRATRVEVGRRVAVPIRECGERRRVGRAPSLLAARVGDDHRLGEAPDQAVAARRLVDVAGMVREQSIDPRLLRRPPLHDRRCGVSRAVVVVEIDHEELHDDAPEGGVRPEALSHETTVSLDRCVRRRACARRPSARERVAERHGVDRARVRHLAVCEDGDEEMAHAVLLLVARYTSSAVSASVARATTTRTRRGAGAGSRLHR